MRASRTTLKLMAACFLSLSLSQVHAQQSACDKIERHASTIMRAAHPSVKRLSTCCTGCRRIIGGFEVTYRFRFKSFWGKRSYTDFTFDLDPQGRICSVSGRTPGWIQPFNVANAALFWLKWKLKGISAIAKSVVLRGLVATASASRLLQLYLRYGG